MKTINDVWNAMYPSQAFKVYTVDETNLGKYYNTEHQMAILPNAKYLVS